MGVLLLPEEPDRGVVQVVVGGDTPQGQGVEGPIVLYGDRPI